MENFNGQKILPAARDIKQLEKLLESQFTYIILLNSHIGQLRSLTRLAKSKNKQLLLHADLVQGLKNDEYAAQFLCQDIRPAGLISTRKSVVLSAKKSGLIAIQRLFLLDSIALETSYKLLEITKPDFIEVLPGVMPHIITEVFEETKIPIIAGGLIRKKEEVDDAVKAGSVAVTTSREFLWEY
ncbi:MAG: glycerol-3-phosphate responsive antiterminator [Bacillaceae bacterium]|nr:glycerol-3-phosphate responsive antiterminator [Bacillaceae bacterium]